MRWWRRSKARNVDDDDNDELIHDCLVLVGEPVLPAAASEPRTYPNRDFKSSCH